jgi:hypothetical protein
MGSVALAPVVEHIKQPSLFDNDVFIETAKVLASQSELSQVSSNMPSSATLKRPATLDFGPPLADADIDKEQLRGPMHQVNDLSASEGQAGNSGSRGDAKRRKVGSQSQEPSRSSQNISHHGSSPLQIARPEMQNQVVEREHPDTTVVHSDSDSGVSLTFLKLALVIGRDRLSDADDLAQQSVYSLNASVSNGFEGEPSRIQLSQQVLFKLRQKKLERDSGVVKAANVGELNMAVSNSRDLVRCECGWHREAEDVLMQCEFWCVLKLGRPASVPSKNPSTNIHRFYQ